MTYDDDHDEALELAALPDQFGDDHDTAGRQARLEELARRVADGWVPFGWHAAYIPDIRLEFDGGTEWDPVWERIAASAARRRLPPLICGGGSSDFAIGGFIPGPVSTRAHWRGWTARVGLRKSRLHFDTPRMRKDVPYSWGGEDSLTYDAGGLLPVVSQTFNASSVVRTCECNCDGDWTGDHDCRCRCSACTPAPFCTQARGAQ
jgi:hypothetical protein